MDPSYLRRVEDVAAHHALEEGDNDPRHGRLGSVRRMPLEPSVRPERGSLAFILFHTGTALSIALIA